MGYKIQKRVILCLDETDKTALARGILSETLSLARNLVEILFEERFEALKEELDSIKEFAAGIHRAEKLAEGYNLAKFYPYFFAFHQFFHSSYRARQGKILEKIIKNLIVKEEGIRVSSSKKDTLEFVKKLIPTYESSSDLDIVVLDERDGQNKRILVIQIRSRDDTGGTTAKHSLIKPFKKIWEKIESEADISYLIGVWEERKEQQKKTTINEVIETLRELDKDNLEVCSEEEIRFSKRTSVRICYGLDKILNTIEEWGRIKLEDKEVILKLLKEVDDLWLAYVIAYLELENTHLKACQSNVNYLSDLLREKNYETAALKSSSEYLRLANKLALDIAPRWKKSIIHFDSPSDMICYIRDLILLKFVYDKFSKPKANRISSGNT
ncbi:MAG: hypothetical protein D6687_01515 [Acidobacteria bacterium]|nr:MAG: hypothetical protein D6687_01515 [Acidobacteriota bacterium]GIU81955.1 MAG: hypothetical protein KatS3mg006_1019 [Pyrinomonadaceae bacterium]